MGCCLSQQKRGLIHMRWKRNLQITLGYRSIVVYVAVQLLNNILMQKNAKVQRRYQ